VIARARVVPRIWPREGTLLRAEYALDRGVDIEVHGLGLQRVHGGEPLLNHHRFQVGDRLVVESAQVAIHGIDARHDSTRETDEERVGRERLQAEHSRLSGDVRVEQKPQLCLHRVDHQDAALEAKEETSELRVDSLPSAKAAEAREAGDAGERRVVLPSMDARRIGATDALVAAIAIPALAATHVPTHLMDARRVRCSCSHQTRQRTRRALNSRESCESRRDVHGRFIPRTRNPGLVRPHSSVVDIEPARQVAEGPPASPT